MDDLLFLNKELPQLLTKLEADTKPVWGVMSAQHMVEHLSGVVLISNGRFDAPAMYEEERLIKNRNYIIDNRNRLKKNNKATILPEEPLPLRFASLAEAITKLDSALKIFHQFYSEHPGASRMHPAFGPLNYEQWTYFHFIHAQYHLCQFGLYEGGAAER